ncbi:von Willebrand factor A domain-containing protein 5B1 [Holothuria leucospilota]|uniref:von Willebrand factor A domain-containing protein 5B1 n=1 Tax=Holothuria leucospilota TaxID=206669 RepID=A0A9Q1BC86_HOLLE|nr:von Willebrand factor A domain-containing protein 5B1 [Holothuria leucospilota]
MPGLINRHTRAPLVLQSCCVSACVNGLSLGIAASLTYFNQEDHVVEGVFGMSLDQHSSVAGFEARLMQGRTITAQLKDRREVEHFNEILTGHTGIGNSNPNLLPPGKFALSEYHSGQVFCANIGTIRPHGNITILLSISSLLTTCRSGVSKIVFPCVFTPRYHPDETSSHSSGGSPLRNRTVPDYSNRSLLDLCEEVAINQNTYEFEFQLEVRAPSLLSGVSSPSHAIRVDADPFADDASDVFVTLAEPHSMDRELEILIHYPKPHTPVVILEHGDISPEEYEHFVKTDREFVTPELEADPEKSKEYLTRRIHKDIMHNATLMLNYCPDFERLTDQMLQSHRFDVPGELIMIVDRSGGMSGEYIANTRETLMMILKSLPINCRFNIVGFGSGFKPLFAASRTYSQEAVSEASAYIMRMRADLGNITNLFSPLWWVYRQVVVRGHPRQLLVLTNGSVTGTAEILDLVKSNAAHTRVHAFGIGENSSRRLIQGMAEAGRGRAEFIATGERMQSKVMKVLSQAVQPAISDIQLEWSMPPGFELIQTPSQHAPIFRGEPIVVYAVLFDKARMESTLANVLSKTNHRSQLIDQCLSRESSTERIEGADYGSSLLMAGSPYRVRRRQDIDRTLSPLKLHLPSSNVLPGRAVVTDEPGSAEESGTSSQSDIARNSRLSPKRSRAVSVPGNTLATVEKQTLETAIDQLNAINASRDTTSNHITDGFRKRCSTGARHNQSSHMSSVSFDFEPMSPSWDNFLEQSNDDLFDHTPSLSLGDAVVLDSGELVDIQNRNGQGSVSISGLFCGRPIRCEVPFDIATLVKGEWKGPSEEDDVWEETIHQLAAASLLNDYERAGKKMVEYEATQINKPMPSDELCKIRAKMVDLSLASHVICRHTAFVSLDLETLEPLPSPTIILPFQHNRHAFRPHLSRVLRQWSSFGTAAAGKPPSSSFTDSEDEVMSSGYGRSESPHSQFSQSFQEVHHPFKTDSNGKPRPEWANEYFTWSLASSYQAQGNGKPPSWHFGSRLNRLKTRLGNMPSKRPLFRAVDAVECCVGRTLSMECVELHALVNLQLASGAWELDHELADAIDITLDRLFRASPICDITMETIESGVAVVAGIDSVEDPGLVNDGREDEIIVSNNIVNLPDLTVTLNTGTNGRDDSRTHKPIQRSRSKPETAKEFAQTKPDRISGRNLSESDAESGPSGVNEHMLMALSQSDSGYQTVRGFSSPDESVSDRNSQVLNLPTVKTYQDSSMDVKEESSGGETARSEGNPSPSKIKRERFARQREVSFDESIGKRLWATALALVWLEHNCASFFNEWELLAAKADHWLSEQRLPKGTDLAGLKASARQIIVLSRRL